ncbi:MAG TPA: hypothetical protein DCX53_05540 [Anaerolineae bacterium]|nr:hypothetical protein [Anaerolineae bacterium]
MNDTFSHKKLRIAFCPPELQPLQLAMRGEPTNATYLLQSHIATRLISRGHELSYIAERDLGDNVFTKDLENPKSAPLTWSDGLPFRMLQKLTWRVQQLFRVPYLNIFTNLRLYDACLRCLPGHDVIYERNGLFRNGIAIACRKLKIPYVLFVEADEILEHDYMEEPLTGLLRRSAGRQFRYNLKTADRVVCVSNQLKSHLVEKWRINAQKIVVLPNGVDVEQFQPDFEVIRQVRKSLSMEDNPLVLFVGNFYEWHDVGTLLESFPQVLYVYPQARLILVGDGTLRESMEQLSIDLGVSHAVHFTGLIPHVEVPQYMASADVAVVPYPKLDHRNWLSPLKLFEYMASAKAIVASEVGQVKDIIQHETNGILVSADDVQEMSEAILRLIEDDDLRVRLGQQARDDAVRKHSWEQYISRLEKVFRDVILEVGAK